jgi:Holliday junction resolvase
LSNKSEGSAFETLFCSILAKHGFWAHNFANRAEGQPADVIAVKGDIAYLIDCKVCEKDYFRLDRIEENQESAMSLWQTCGNRGAYFAVRLADGSTYMVPFREAIDAKRRGWTSLKRKDLIMYVTLDEWMRARK